jgi:hypothetical protein
VSAQALERAAGLTLSCGTITIEGRTDCRHHGCVDVTTIESSVPLERPPRAIKERTEKALKAIGGPSPEEVMQTLADQMRGGSFFCVDEATGEPIIDLRGLAAAGRLHLPPRSRREPTEEPGRW